MTRAALAYLAALGVATAAGHWFSRRMDRRAEIAALEAMYALPAAVREDGAP